jgi:hypothetical protein
MTSLNNLSLEKLTPQRLWAEVDIETRRIAARCVYDPEWDDVTARVQADAAIAAALRFRDAAVRRLPIPKRVEHLTRLVRLDDSLVTGLLRALHLSERREMLGAFLDALGIPQDNGIIDTDETLDPPGSEMLRKAVGALGSYPEEDVELYLLALLTMEPEFWAGLADVLRPRA